MSDKNRSYGRRRGGLRFRPSGGIKAGQKRPERAAQEARAAALGDKSGPDPVYEQQRHENEIRRAENLAAGLPPDTTAESQKSPVTARGRDQDFREPNLQTPAQVKEDEFVPVDLKQAPKGLMASIKQAATKVIRKVKRLMRPPQKIHKEVIINAESLETRVAVLEDGKLEEFNIERTEEDRLVGSIFKGKVRNLEDGLKAAFVDIGFEKNAFLHYWDIVPSNFDSSVEVVEREGRKRERDKPKITQKDVPRLFPAGSDITVQVTKGPIGTKGPRVTTNLVLPGRYLVLLPNSDQCGISRKIESHEERQRLKRILRKLTIPEGMGVIIRTVGEGQQARYFVRDLALLLEEWSAIQNKIRTKSAPACVFNEPDLIERTVRDFLTEDVERIVVDDSRAYDRMREMIGRISKRSSSKVKLYSESTAIFDRFSITRQLEMAFSRTVHLKSGGYMVVDETEALVAIDVNTGRHKGTKDQESTIFKVNEEAADEICRQLRLRNMGGLIVLDFIDMKNHRDRQAIYNRMKEGLKRDRAKTHVLPISQLGLIEMTRQRHTESVRAAVFDDCPYCKGRGKVKSSLTMSVEIQRRLSEILRKRFRDESDFQLRIVVHPSVLERLRKEDERLIIEMEKKYFGRLSFRADPSIHLEHFKIYNSATNEELGSN